MFLFLLGFLVLFGGFIWVNLKRVSDVNAGAELVNRGAYVEALAHYEAASRRVLKTGIERLNQAVVLIRLWRLEEARSAFEASLRKPHANERPFTARVKVELALTLALLGETSEVSKLLEGQTETPIAILTDAVLAARAQRFADVRTLMSGREAYLLGGSFRALSEVLLAWSQLELDGAPRQRIEVDQLFGEGGPGALPKAWPELLTAIARLEGQVEPPAASAPLAVQPHA